MARLKRIGVLTGGGDAPGLNAVIRAVVKAGVNNGIEVVGLEDSFDGLIEPNRSRVMTAKDVTGILRRGGTVLGTVNRGDPFAYPIETSEGKHDYSTRVVEMFHRMGLDALVVIGGDGTLAIAHKFSRMGIPIVGVPKTIDNDIVQTTSTFGFDTAVAFATDAIDRLHTTAEAHRRIIVVEVMGRNTGWIALYAGVGGGADVILIPEIPYDLKLVAQQIQDRDAWGAHFSIVVVAEGCTTFGALCFCHASQRRSAENEKTTRAMRRCVSIMVRDSGHRVETAVVPRVAFRHAPHGKPRAAQGPVLANRIHRVFGARGREPALPAPPGAQQVPVAADRGEQQAGNQRAQT